MARSVPDPEQLITIEADTDEDRDPTDSLSSQANTTERKPHPVEFTPEELTKIGQELAAEILAETSNDTQAAANRARWQKVYMAEPENAIKTYPIADGSSNVVIPMVANFCDQVVARIMQSVFSVQPHWTATALNKKFSPAVKPLERWFDWIRQNVWNQEKIVKSLVQETVKIGTSCLYQGWCDETRMRYDDVTKTTIPASRKYGPSPQWVSREDILIPTGYYDHQTSPYFGHRTWFSFDQLRSLEFSNYIENVDKLRGQPDVGEEMERMRNQDHQSPLARDERYGLWAIWNVWFSRDFDGDGFPEEYVMMLHAETGTILRLKPNPYPSQMRPYVITRFIEKEGEFDGIGIAQMVEQLQDEQSTIHNQRRDRAHLANIVMYLANAASNLPDSIRPKNGKVIKVLSTTDIKEFHPSSGLQENIFEEQSVAKIAQERVGLYDWSQGNISSPVGRAAATTVMALMQEGTRRFDLNTTEIRNALSEQGHQVAELYQTYGMPNPDMPGSPEQVLDEKDAQAVREILQLQDNLRNFLSIELNISTQAVNREVEKQSNVQLYQQLGQYQIECFQMAMPMMTPQAPPELKAAVAKALMGKDRLIQRVLNSFQAYDLEDALVGELLAQSLLEQAQHPQPQLPQTGQIGGPPNGQAGPPQPPTPGALPPGSLPPGVPTQ